MMNFESERKSVPANREFVPKSIVLCDGAHDLPMVRSSFKDKEFTNGGCTFIIRDWNEVISKLQPENVTSVGALCVIDNQIVLVKNKRGWDIPGGHVEGNETILEALRREIREETGSECLFTYPLIVLESKRDITPTYIPVFMARISKVNIAHQRTNEISNVKMVSQAEFLSSYHGNPIFAAAVTEVYNQLELRLGK